MPTGKLTGKAQSLTFDGVAVYTTSVKPKTTKEYDDSTDSGDYDATSQLIHKSQLAWGIQTELAVEGKFYLSGTGATITAFLDKLYSGAAAAAGSVKLDGSNTYISGNFDLTDFEADISTDKVVTFKCTLKTNGVATVGS